MGQLCPPAEHLAASLWPHKGGRKSTGQWKGGLGVRVQSCVEMNLHAEWEEMTHTLQFTVSFNQETCVFAYPGEVGLHVVLDPGATVLL